MFFSILWKLSSKYMPRQSSMFVNIPVGIIENSAAPETSQANNQGFPPYLAPIKIQSNLLVLILGKGNLEEGINDDDYQALTEKEEKDLEYLLAQTDDALSDAEKFMEQLAKDLSLLDGVLLYINDHLNQF